MHLSTSRFILALTLLFSVLFTQAATIVAVKNGPWISPGTWGGGAVPKRTDTIIIPENIKVAITRPLVLGPSVNGKALVITVAGELDLTNGSIQLDAMDRIIVLPGGKVSTQNMGGMIFSGIYSLYLEGGTHVRGPATLGDGFSPLALLYFNAEQAEGGVKLTWASAGEININTYNISRSTDGVTYEHVGTVDANAKSRKQKNYSYTDSQKPEGDVRYRIDATDGNGLRAALATLEVSVGNSDGSVSIFTDDTLRRP
jgi:hypothetical protein